MDITPSIVATNVSITTSNNTGIIAFSDGKSNFEVTIDSKAKLSPSSAQFTVKDDLGLFVTSNANVTVGDTKSVNGLIVTSAPVTPSNNTYSLTIGPPVTVSPTFVPVPESIQVPINVVVATNQGKKYFSGVLTIDVTVDSTVS